MVSYFPILRFIATNPVVGIVSLSTSVGISLVSSRMRLVRRKAMSKIAVVLGDENGESAFYHSASLQV